MGTERAPLPPSVARAVERYLGDADRLLPGRVVGFYVVGSVALGAHRDGRSDVDFVAVLGGADGNGADGDRGAALDRRELRRIRTLHVRSGLRTATAALRARRSPLSGTCNGVFVRPADLARPVTGIVPVAHHVGTTFSTGPAGSDVSPVAWKVLAERGIAVRGPAPGTLPLDPEPGRLREWNLGNLHGYWRPWAEGVRRAPRARFRWRPRWWTAWGALGAPRLHRTIATGEVVSKETAGEHALDAFPARWHPLVADALAYRRGEPPVLRMPPEERARRTADFVSAVIADAERIAAG